MLKPARKRKLAQKRTRAIGLYNFCAAQLDCLLANATTPPALHYIHRRVGLGADSDGLRAYSEAKGIKTVAYGALGAPVVAMGLVAALLLRQRRER